MRKIVIIILFTFLLLLNTKVSYATEYLSYQEVEFNHSTVRFLDTYTQAMYDKYYKFTDTRKFWGWNSYTVFRTEPLTFKKETLHVIKNEGTTEITENFTFELKESLKMQINASGSISMKGSGSKKTFKLGLDQKFTSSITATQTTNKTENFNLKIHVDPGTILYVEVVGEGKLSNGVAKYYAFWRCIKKGGWEVFIVTTEYYSLRKEKLYETEIDVS